MPEHRECPLSSSPTASVPQLVAQNLKGSIFSPRSKSKRRFDGYVNFQLSRESIITLFSTNARTRYACRNEVEHQCNDINRQLKLHELLDVDVDGATPSSDVHYSCEIVIHYDNIRVFFCNLYAVT